MSYNQSNAPGKKLLKASGTLMVIFGAVFFLISINSLETPVSPDGDKFLAVLWFVFILIGVIHGVIGIVGVNNCDELKKSKTCFVLGISAVISTLLRTLVGVEIGLHWNLHREILTICILLSIPPVLFLIGAVKKRIAETKNGEGSKDGQID